MDNSNVDEHGNTIVPEVVTSPTDELTKERYKQQLEGKDALATKQRNVITTALKDKDLAKAAQLLQEAEPKVFASVMKELGHDTLESYVATLKPNEPDREMLRKYYEEFETERQTTQAKAKVDSQFEQLPEDIKETAKSKFTALTEGRNLTAEQTEAMAQDAITLAQAQHGTKHTIDYARMNFATSPISSPVVTIKKESDEVDQLIK